ncbi:MAG: signal peptidase I [Chitinivibrionales bacterium]|nr:signal peptidase I [Chitinivibrionales bacterium]
MALSSHVSAGDSSVTVVRLILRILLIALALLIFRYAACDSYSIKTVQMKPSVLPGDRLIVSRFAYAFPFKLAFRPRRGDVVIGNLHAGKDSLFCLRIVALPGDTLSIHDGRFINNAYPDDAFRPKLSDTATVVPMDYSLRDYMATLTLPHKGKRVLLDSLNIRDFCLTAGMIAMANPDRTYRIRARLFIDGIEMPEYRISAFALYRGAFDSIPASLSMNSFFWSRLLDFLRGKHEEKEVSLLLSLFEKDNLVITHTFRQSFIFLLADNWQSGYDSRFFGPVNLSRIRGSAVSVLWSAYTDSTGSRNIRFNRIGKFIS